VLEEALLILKDKSLEDMGVQKKLKILIFPHQQIISNNLESLAHLLAKTSPGSLPKKLLKLDLLRL
jgi:hypothetical protein